MMADNSRGALNATEAFPTALFRPFPPPLGEQRLELPLLWLRQPGEKALGVRVVADFSITAAVAKAGLAESCPKFAEQRFGRRIIASRTLDLVEFQLTLLRQPRRR